MKSVLVLVIAFALGCAASAVWSRRSISGTRALALAFLPITVGFGLAILFC